MTSRAFTFASCQRLNRISLTAGVLASLCSGCGTTPGSPSTVPNLTGNYSLTVAPSSTCPGQLQERSFVTGDAAPFHVTQDGSQVTGVLSFGPGPTLMSGDLSGQVMSSDVVWLTLRFHSSNSHIGVRDASGSGRGLVSSGSITGALDGHLSTADVFGSFSSPLVVCDATDHHFILRRVGL